MSVRDVCYDEEERALIVLLYVNKKVSTILGSMQNGKIFAKSQEEKTIMGEVQVFKWKKDEDGHQLVRKWRQELHGLPQCLFYQSHVIYVGTNSGKVRMFTMPEKLRYQNDQQYESDYSDIKKPKGKIHQNKVMGIALSDDSDLIYTASIDGSVLTTNRFTGATKFKDITEGSFTGL